VKIVEIKASTIIFWVLAAVLLIFGTLYIAWPIAPYHEGIIGMTAEELATNLPEINNLMVALVNVAGIGFLAIGIFIAYLGRRAWKESGHWYTLLSVFIAFFLPLVYIVYAIGGPLVLAVALAVIQGTGLGVSSTIDRNW
jgi:hypothetical protein